MYLLIEGAVAVAVKGEDGRHHPVTELAPGDYFGELALLDRVPPQSQCAGRREFPALQDPP